MNRVDCVNIISTANPWDRIVRLSGTHDSDGQRWSCTHAQCVAYVEQGYQFYIEPQPGTRHFLEVAVSMFGRKYVRTALDQDEPEQLMRLVAA